MITEEKLIGKNGRTVHVVYKSAPWREYVDEFMRDDLDFMVVQFGKGLYSSIYNAKSGLDAAIRKLRRKDISSVVMGESLCLIRN